VTDPAPTCYRHADRVTYVRCTRCDRSICGECQVPASVGFQCPEEQGGGPARARAAYGGRLRARADVTYALVAVNVGVFLVTLASGGDVLFGSGSSPLYRDFAMQPVTLLVDDRVVEGVADGEWWRLVTAGFLHYGIFHLAFNMMALLSFGPHLEHALGRWRFLALYLLCAVAGSVVSYAFGPTNVQSAGASGALYGLVGGALALGRRRGEDPRPLLGYLAFGVLFTLAVPQIDWRAHAGGLAAGFAAGTALFIPPGRARSLVQALGVVAVVLVVVAGAVARTAVLDDGG
jgi:membrane associated rhomboid family serine protease